MRQQAELSGDKERSSDLHRQGNLFEVAPIYAVRTRPPSRKILGQGYHVVVGNPPYITVKDRGAERGVSGAVSDLPPASIRSACRSPQRFWDLAIQAATGERGDRAATSA